MSQKILIFLIITFSTIFTRSSLAADVESAMVRETETIVTEFKAGDLAPHTQIALNAVVRRAIKELKKRGYKTEAEQYSKEWEDQFSDYFTAQFSTFNVGDHAPLNQWLGKFYKELNAKIPTWILDFLSISDINTLNYTIPVVFQPRGDARNGDKWSKAEYRKHFTLFAGVVAYWSADLACDAATASLGWISYACDFAADIPQYAMKAWISPPISDFIYTEANGGGRSLEALPEFDIPALLEQARTRPH